MTAQGTQLIDGVADHLVEQRGVAHQGLAKGAADPRRACWIDQGDHQVVSLGFEFVLDGRVQRRQLATKGLHTAGGSPRAVFQSDSMAGRSVPALRLSAARPRWARDGGWVGTGCEAKGSIAKVAAPLPGAVLIGSRGSSPRAHRLGIPSINAFAAARPTAPARLGGCAPYFCDGVGTMLLKPPAGIPWDLSCSAARSTTGRQVTLAARNARETQAGGLPLLSNGLQVVSGRMRGVTL